MKSDRQLSTEAGKYCNWLAQVKATNKEKYDYLIKNGIRKFEAESVEIRHFLSTIYYSNMTVSSLYSDYASDLYKNEGSFRRALENAAFSLGERALMWGAFKRFRLFKERIENVQKR